MRSVGIALLLAAHAAYAQPTELTKEFQAGVDAYRLGKYDEARVHLEKARKLDPKLPGPHRFLAATAQAQGRWPECIESAHAALVLNPISSETADTRKLYEGCRISAGRTPARVDLGDSGAIAVTTNVPGATVKINGLTYGGTPLAPRPITPGTLEIEIEKAGWMSAKSTVEAIGGIVTDVNVDLEPDPNAQIQTDIAVEGAKITVGYLVVPAGSGTLTIDGGPPPEPKNDRLELSPGTHLLEFTQPGKDPFRRRVRISAGQKVSVTPMFMDAGERSAKEHKGFVTLGVGGAILAGGFVAAMMSRRALDDARDIARIERTRDPTQPLSATEGIAPVRTREDLQDARDRHARWAVISNAAYLTGIITSGVGAYFLYKGARERSDIPPPFAIAPLEGGAMIAKEGVW